MATAVWSIALALAAILLAFTTYAAVIGAIGAFSRARYLQCPLCHHHFLVPRGSLPVHQCPHGPGERVHRAARQLVHHQHLQPH